MDFFQYYARKTSLKWSPFSCSQVQTHEEQEAPRFPAISRQSRAISRSAGALVPVSLPLRHVHYAFTDNLLFNDSQTRNRFLPRSRF